MIDYSKGKIYRLVCNTTGNQYIGSTTQSLSQRLGGHKGAYKWFLTGKTTKQTSSFSILSNNNFEMILIEEYCCENKNQLERRERYYIEITKCVNKQKPAQMTEEIKKYHKQYRQDNLEEIKEKSKIYRQENKKELAEYNKQYYQENLEEIKEQKKIYYQENLEEKKENSKQYHQDNKEKINEYQKKYRQENQEKLTTLTKCECGGKYQYHHKSIHFKSNRHKKWATPETI
jgi:hypothetical protein